MKYFTGCKTIEELKAEYRRLTKIHHPDRGGDTETMKAINLEYETAFNRLKDLHNAKSDEFHQNTETAAEFIDIIEKLLKIGETIKVELCGSWLWISGATYENREALKAAGCRFSGKKKMWYWCHPEEGHKHYKKSATMEEIRAKYGSQVFEGEKEHRISAGG